MDEDAELLERAFAYPFATPGRSFVLVGDAARDPAEVRVAPVGRTPLLAYGSNAAPAVLARNLRSSAAADPVPVVRARLVDLDVVYSAHVAAYGSVPATIQRSPGAEADVAIAYVTGRQMRLIARTEPNYDLVELPGGSCRLEEGASIPRAVSFVTRHGCLAIEGAEVALAAVATRGRRFRAMGQRETLRRVRDLLDPDSDLDRFVLGGVRDPEVARRRTEALRRAARPLDLDV